MTLLTKRMVEKPWGKDVLPPPFRTPDGKRIGEVWFEPPPEMPAVLVKYIFTSEKLSVQVHPNDAQAQELGESGCGKDECWLVIDAEPGATLGVGFKHPVDAQTMRAAALDGTIEDLMAWYPVKPGDFFYIPAGTVHAIGAGVSLIEIQQNSDITYRLYDYGRPRELHLDKGIAVARGEPHDPALRRRNCMAHTSRLVSGRYFNLDYLIGSPSADHAAKYQQTRLILPMSHTVTVDGESIGPGDCAFAASDAATIFEPATICLVVSF